MEKPYPGCIRTLWLAHRSRGVPETAINILISSLAENTIKQYNTTYKKWWGFCRGDNVFNAEPNRIMEFLNAEFEKGSNFNTLNQHRSAINTLLQSTDHPSVTRFMKGVFRLRPVFPRYNETWDPNPVLDYFESLGPLNTLSLEKLTYKLVILLALTTSQRVQTLTKIKLSYIKYFKEKLEINIPDIIKTSAPKKCQPKIVLPYFSERPNICVASTLKFYIAFTTTLRQNNDQLLITTKKPHHPASSQTVSKWIKKGLTLGGVDTRVFKAHSTRHASTSAALRGGLNIETIRRTAGWSDRSNVFAIFYNRPTSDDLDFAKTLINKD